MVAIETTNQTLRRAGLVAGIGLLLMAVLAGFANFGVIEGLVAQGDAARTAQNIIASEGLFRFGVVSLILVAILDVVVAWALKTFFKPVHKGLSALAAWFRLMYTGVFVVAISQLAAVPHLLSNAGYLKAFSTDQLQTQALLNINTFQNIWDVGLILFGIHLVLLGYLAYKSGYVPKLVGALLAIAGSGYLIDSLGTLLVSGYSAKIATLTFVGEVVLMVWLLVKARKVTLSK